MKKSKAYQADLIESLMGRRPSQFRAGRRTEFVPAGIKECRRSPRRGWRSLTTRRSSTARVCAIPLGLTITSTTERFSLRALKPVS
jgi:hypothetical protein